MLLDALFGEMRDLGVRAAIGAVIGWIAWRICTNATDSAIKRLFETGPALYEILKWAWAWGGSLFFALQATISIYPPAVPICLEVGQAATFFPACVETSGSPLYPVAYVFAALFLAAIASLYGKLGTHLSDVAGRVSAALLSLAALVLIAAAAVFLWKSNDPRTDLTTLAEDIQRRLFAR